MDKSLHVHLHGDAKMHAIDNRLVVETAADPAALSNAVAHAQTEKRTSAFDLLASQPWAIDPDMLETMRTIALREHGGIEAVEAKLGRPLQNARKVSLRDGVAVVPVTGPIFRYANLFTQISGATSLDVLAKDFNAALEDPNVSSIVLDINSLGGQAAGISDFAQMVHGAAKPVVAFIDGMAASAAYWIAAAASTVVISKSGMAGNVGAVLSLNNRKDPNTTEIVSSQSPNKRPDVTTDAGRAQIQAMVDSLAQVFIEDVAAYRGMTPEAVIADFGGGAVFTGAKAVAAGMADRIGTLESVIAELSGRAGNIKGALNMTAETLAPAAAPVQIDRAYLAEYHAGLLAELQAEGAAAERARILEVQAQAKGFPGHDDLIASLVSDGKTTGVEAAAQILSAERSKGAARLEAIKKEAPKPVAHAAGDDIDSGASSLPVEDQARADWYAKPELRDEFPSFEAYLGYRKAVGKGYVKVLGKTK